MTAAAPSVAPSAVVAGGVSGQPPRAVEGRADLFGDPRRVAEQILPGEVELSPYVRFVVVFVASFSSYVLLVRGRRGLAGLEAGAEAFADTVNGVDRVTGAVRAAQRAPVMAEELEVVD